MNRMSPTRHITVVGSANIDLTFRAAKLPRPGETVFGTSFDRGFGGKGANQAVAAARLGAAVSFVGRVGADEFGRAMRDQLVREGVDVLHLLDDPDRPTGTAVILVDDAGENAIVGVPGANLGLTPADVRTAAPLLESSAIVLAPCETMIETVTEAFRIAHAAGRMCVFNPAPARELPAELLTMLDVIVPNESELRTLSGRPTETIDDVVAAAEALRAGGPRIVIVTLGPRGVLVVGPDGRTHIPGVPVTAVDTSGAGDAFCGELVTGLAAGLSMVEAARRANAVAAWSVTRPGTQASFARREEI
jgi:ribokinase